MKGNFSSQIPEGDRISGFDTEKLSLNVVTTCYVSERGDSL